MKDKNLTLSKKEIVTQFQFGAMGYLVVLTNKGRLFKYIEPKWVENYF